MTPSEGRKARNEYMRQYRSRRKEELKVYYREYYAKNKDKYADSNRKYWEKKAQLESGEQHGESNKEL